MNNLKEDIRSSRYRSVDNSLMYNISASVTHSVENYVDAFLWGTIAYSGHILVDTNE